MNYDEHISKKEAMKLLTAIILLTFVFIPKINAQSLEDRYIRAILYLRTNDNINADLNEKVSKRFKVDQNYIHLHVDTYIRYISIVHFIAQLKQNNVGIDTSFISNPAKHTINYDFVSSENKMLERLFNFQKSPYEQSGLIITFSKPFEDYLVAEIRIVVNTKKRGTFLIHGYAIQILFIFDEENYVTNYLITTYNWD